MNIGIYLILTLLIGGGVYLWFKLLEKYGSRKDSKP